jgi:hypothetical protein
MMPDIDLRKPLAATLSTLIMKMLYIAIAETLVQGNVFIDYWKNLLLIRAFRA